MKEQVYCYVDSIEHWLALGFGVITVPDGRWHFAVSIPAFSDTVYDLGGVRKIRQGKFDVFGEFTIKGP